MAGAIMAPWSSELAAPVSLFRPEEFCSKADKLSQRRSGLSKGRDLPALVPLRGLMSQGRVAHGAALPRGVVNFAPTLCSVDTPERRICDVPCSTRHVALPRLLGPDFSRVSPGAASGHLRRRDLSLSAGAGAMEEALYDRDHLRGYLKDEPATWQEPWGLDDVGAPITLPPRLVFPQVGRDRADDITLHNPLKRLERLGCGWLAVLLEWEGVVVEDDTPLERKSWALLAAEEGKPQPAGFLLRRADGMKNEQVIGEVLCWARDYRSVKRLAQRRDEIFQELQGGCYRLRPGSKEFVELMKKYSIPVAVLSTRPKHLLDSAIEAVGMEGVFDLVVAAEDVARGKPDPEMFQYAATCLQFIPDRCIVVGNSNLTIEAAHDAYMKVVAVSGKHPLYELGAADLVVPRLDDLSIVDLKNLAGVDSPEFHIPEPELELEPEEEKSLPKTLVADL